jgi:hypothetical protein
MESGKSENEVMFDDNGRIVSTKQESKKGKDDGKDDGED